MNKYYFFKTEGDQKFYLGLNRLYTYLSPNQAGLFTQQDFETWGSEGGWSKEEPDDQTMRGLGAEIAPMLPGWE